MITYKDLISEITLKSNPFEFNIGNHMWTEFENEIKIKLPDDYKNFINLYGTGRLAELIWVLNPFAAKERFNLISFLNNKKNAYNYLEKEYELKIPFSLFSNGEGILPFAFTDNGDTIYWNIKSLKIKESTIVLIDSRDSLFEEYSYEFAEFLFKILNGLLNSSILNDEDIKSKDFVPLKTDNYK
ncbi:MAG: SMI1/KNR4 family protein [Ginsengibacter sp.]